MQPPRLATAAQARHIRHFYYWTNLSNEYLALLFALFVLPLLVSLAAHLLLPPARLDVFFDQYFNRYTYGGLVAAFEAWRVGRRWRRAAHALAAYRLGRAVPLYLVSLTSYSPSSSRGRIATRYTLTLRKDNELLTVKTTDTTIVNAYNYPQQLAYVLDTRPDIVLPASIADAPDTPQPQLPTRRVSI